MLTIFDSSFQAPFQFNAQGSENKPAFNFTATSAPSFNFSNSAINNNPQVSLLFCLENCRVKILDWLKIVNEFWSKKSLFPCVNIPRISNRTFTNSVPTTAIPLRASLRLYVECFIFCFVFLFFVLIFFRFPSCCASFSNLTLSSLVWSFSAWVLSACALQEIWVNLIVLWFFFLDSSFSASNAVRIWICTVNGNSRNYFILVSLLTIITMIIFNCLICFRAQSGSVSSAAANQRKILRAARRTTTRRWSPSSTRDML